MRHAHTLDFPDIIEVCYLINITINISRYYCIANCIYCDKNFHTVFCCFRFHRPLFISTLDWLYYLMYLIFSTFLQYLGFQVQQNNMLSEKTLTLASAT
jgi:hypothetical protein